MALLVQRLGEVVVHAEAGGGLGLLCQLIQQGLINSHISIGIAEFQKLLIISDVILLLIHFARQHHANSARGEVLQVTPHAGLYVETLVGAVKEEGTFAFAIVEGDGERT